MVLLSPPFEECNKNYDTDSIEWLIAFVGAYIHDFERAEQYSIRQLVRYLEYWRKINGSS